MSPAGHRVCEDRLRIRADFDWAGLRILDRLHEPPRTELWRMAASDYRECAPSRPLPGAPFVSAWAAELADAMRDNGHAAYEEELIDPLIGDLGKKQSSPTAQA